MCISSEFRMPTRKYADTFLFTLENVVILPRNTVFGIKKIVLADVPSCSELPCTEELDQ